MKNPPLRHLLLARVYFWVVLLLIVAEMSFNIRMRAIDSAWVEPPAERKGKIDPGLFSAITFGNIAAAIDWLWIQFLLDPAISHVSQGEHPAIFYDLDLLTDLDPMFHLAYFAGGNFLAVIRDDGSGARDILEKGERFRHEELPKYSEEFQNRFWSQDWDIPVTLAYVYLFELNDMPKSANEFREAAKLEGVPGYVRLLDARLNKAGESTRSVSIFSMR